VKVTTCCQVARSFCGFQYCASSCRCGLRGTAQVVRQVGAEVGRPSSKSDVRQVVRRAALAVDERKMVVDADDGVVRSCRPAGPRRICRSCRTGRCRRNWTSCLVVVPVAVGHHDVEVRPARELLATSTAASARRAVYPLVRSSGRCAIAAERSACSSMRRLRRAGSSEQPAVEGNSCVAPPNSRIRVSSGSLRRLQPVQGDLCQVAQVAPGGALAVGSSPGAARQRLQRGGSCWPRRPSPARRAATVIRLRSG